MITFEWNDSYSVKIESIDEQHKKLFSIFKKTQDIIQNAQIQADLNEIFKEALDYTEEHFTYEEKLLSENDFPDFANHKLEHEKFRETVQNFIYRYKQTDSAQPQPVEILGFLINWLLTHITKKDMEYSALLISKGVV